MGLTQRLTRLNSSPSSTLRSAAVLYVDVSSGTVQPVRFRSSDVGKRWLIRTRDVWSLAASAASTRDPLLPSSASTSSAAAANSKLSRQPLYVSRSPASRRSATIQLYSRCRATKSWRCRDHIGTVAQRRLASIRPARIVSRARSHQRSIRRARTSARASFSSDRHGVTPIDNTGFGRKTISALDRRDT